MPASKSSSTGPSPIRASAISEAYNAPDNLSEQSAPTICTILSIPVVGCSQMPSVTRKSQGTRGQRRDEARARLLGVVEELLDEGESFTELSVERLVQAAGMSRSTFY